MLDPRQADLITQAVTRVVSELRRQAPFMAEQTLVWMKQLAGSDQPDAYFKHPRAFSFLMLPWWVEDSLRQPLDLDFQGKMAYSSINAYYYIRLMDNLMDGNATLETTLLPVTVFFSTQTQAVYQEMFDHDHPFWPYFRETWVQQSEATVIDTCLERRTEQDFFTVVSQKVCSARIPVAAVCYHTNHVERIAAWGQLIDKLGAWHQMQQDLFDWHKDLAQQHMTYFLSEAERRKQPDESIPAWVFREGIDWAVETLCGWMQDIRTLAAGVAYPPLLDYLSAREALLLAQRREMDAGLRVMAKLMKTGARND